MATSSRNFSVNELCATGLSGLETHKLIIVSFSGIDGAGKSTQIRALRNELRQRRFRVFRTSFWNHAVVLKRFREKLSHAAFKGDQGVGSPDTPLTRRDKNVTAWYLTFIRCVFYSLDALRLGRFVASIRNSSVDVAIFDRYIYDELANLSPNRLVQQYVRVLLKVIPKPDLAFLLDVDPADARRRKPEYPLDFLQQNRSSFLALAHRAGMIVLNESTMGPLESRIFAAVMQSHSAGHGDGVEHSAQAVAGSAPDSHAAPTPSN